MNVFDASALLAFLAGEDGADVVEAAMERGGLVGAANWSEVAQKVRQSGRSWDVARALLFSYPITVEPVLQEDAEEAAATWRAGRGLSLADRLCLALGHRMGAAIWTADTAWEGLPSVRGIRSGG